MKKITDEENLTELFNALSALRWDTLEESPEVLEEHIKKFYNNRVPEFYINTLSIVLNKMIEVKKTSDDKKIKIIKSMQKRKK